MEKSDVIHTKHLGDNRYRELKVYYQKRSTNYWDYSEKPTGIYFASHQFTKSEGIRSWSTGQKGDGYICAHQLDRYRPSALKAIKAIVEEHAETIHTLLDDYTASNMEKLQALLRGEPIEMEAAA